MSLPFFSPTTFSNPRNNFDGCVGFGFTVGAANLTVVALGRWKVAGNTQTHTVSIKTMNGTVIAAVSVDMATGTAGSFVYAGCLATLVAGTQYICVSSEVNGGDSWYDSTTGTVTAVASFDGATFQGSCAGAPSTPPGVGGSYVPPNFAYDTGTFGAMHRQRYHTRG